MFVALFFKPLIEKLKYQQGGQIMSLCVIIYVD